MRKLLALGALLSAIAGAQELPKVIEGKSGWLFINEELQRFEGTQNVYNEQLGAIAQVVNIFRSQGISVVVVPVPTKASVYPEFLPDGLKSSIDYKSSYSKMLSDFKRLNIQAIDIKTPMLNNKEKGLIYFKTDTHWTPLGIQVAAQSINKNLAGSLATLPEVKFKSEVHPPIDGNMDLVKLLPSARQASYSGEKITGLSLTSAELDLLDDPSPASIVLLGTSYSTVFDGRSLSPEYERLFSKALSISTKRDVLNFAVGGRGFWQPIVDYAKSDEYKSHLPELVLWEIPERFLSFEAPSQWAIPSFPWLEAQLTQGKNDCTKHFSVCDKNTSTMKYVLNWNSINLVTGTNIYRSTVSGFFDREATIRHAGPDKSQITFWLRQPEKLKLNYALTSAVGAQPVQIYLNDKLVKTLNLTASSGQTDTLTLQGATGQNRIEFRFSNWNTKSTTFSSGDTRKIAVTFSQLEIKK